MANWWKAKREVTRVWTQISEARLFAMGPVNRIYYDRFLKPQVRITEGNVPELSDLAIILIYQPDGLVQSTYDQLDHLISKGVAPIVVSNAPLSPSDEDRLKHKTRLILCRPNFGYDFGGYRDALLHVQDTGMEYGNLFLLNDSIWFPLYQDCDLIDRARRADSDVFGIYYTKKSRKTRHWHLHSYFYRFSKDLAASEVFAAYWRKMPMFQGSKRIIIRQFEIKLTAYFTQRGYTASGLYEAQDVRDAYAALSDAELHEVATRQLGSDQIMRTVFAPMKNLSPGDPDWQSAKTNVLERSKVGTYFLNAHPYVFLRELRSPILKKNREDKFVRQRAEIFQTGLQQMLSPTIKTEVENWDPR